MGPATAGLITLAFAVILSQRLGLKMYRSPVSTVLALLFFLIALAAEGFVVVSGEVQAMCLVLWSATIGWFLLLGALVGATGSFQEGEVEVRDPMYEEYMAYREEKIRAKMRERLNESEQ